MASFPPAPQKGTFPPPGPTTLTATLPSYLYQQYADDSDLQAFATAFNGRANVYVSWFAGPPALADYRAQSGPLLDWVAQGVYGFVRPTLSSGKYRSVGPYDTTPYNTLPYNKIRKIGPTNVTVTNDDIFRRIITWNYYKGDGNRFNVRWLKRRIMRFLLGVNGTAPNIDNTYPVSISFGTGGVVSIKLSSGSRKVLSGAYNTVPFNKIVPYNALMTVFQSGPNPLPNESVLQQAIQSGVLQLPFQFDFLISVPH